MTKTLTVPAALDLVAKGNGIRMSDQADQKKRKARRPTKADIEEPIRLNLPPGTTLEKAAKRLLRPVKRPKGD